MFEVDVTIPSDHGDIAYVGFGSGRNNVVLDNEPSHAYMFRIHNLPKMPFYGIDVAVGDPNGTIGLQNAFRSLSRIGEYTPGQTMRFQISHRAGTVTLAIPSHPNARETFDMAEYRDLFDSDHGFLFLSNSSKGTTFSNASMRAH